MPRHAGPQWAPLSLVILQSGFDPAVVKLLGWLIQDQLEVDFGAAMFSNQLDKAGCAPTLSPKALTGFANPASAGHAGLLCFQFPWADAAEDESAVSAAPKCMDSLVAIVFALVFGAADGHHVVQGELWVLTGARSYRSSLQSLRFQRSLQEPIDLRLGVAQTLVEDLRLLVGNQRNPPEFTVAPPGDLDLYHAMGPQSG